MLAAGTAIRSSRRWKAIAAYDRAVALCPKQAASLYGRGLSERPLDHNEAADADIAAAKAIDPHVAEEYAGYGVIA